MNDQQFFKTTDNNH